MSAQQEPLDPDLCEECQFAEIGGHHLNCSHEPYNRGLAAGRAIAEAERVDAARLRQALTYYATRQHLATPDDWDSCSGEHSMWQFPDPTEEAMVEGGWIAQQALAGKPLTFLSPDGKLIDSDEPNSLDATRAEK